MERMTKPLLAILLLLPLPVSAGDVPDWKKMGECSARHVIAEETIRSLSVDILAVEVAQEMETSGDASQAGIEYASDSQVLDDCQVEAQQSPKGLWEDEDPMPPWKWRRR